MSYDLDSVVVDVVDTSQRTDMLRLNCCVVLLLTVLTYPSVRQIKTLYSALSVDA